MNPTYSTVSPPEQESIRDRLASTADRCYVLGSGMGHFHTKGETTHAEISNALNYMDVHVNRKGGTIHQKLYIRINSVPNVDHVLGCTSEIALRHALVLRMV